jgi:hypothetical protein
VTRAVTEADVDALLAAGWAPCSHPRTWRDPATGREMLDWRALAIVRRDARGVRL